MSENDHRVPGKMLAGVAAAVSLLTLLLFLALRGLGNGGGGSDGGGGGTPVAAPKVVSMEQFHLSGSPLPAGDRTKSGVLIRAQLDQPGATFEAQARKPSEAWERTEIRSEPVNREGRAEAYLYLPAGDYRWRGRARGAGGETSEWEIFGKNPDAKAFSIGEDIGGTSAGSAKMNQHDWSGAVLPQGGRSQRGIRLTVEGAKGTARFEAEIKPESQPFDEAHVDFALIDPGGRGEMSVPLPTGKYRWRGRVRGADGSVSPWIRLFGDAERVTDFEVESGSSTSQPAEKETRQEPTPEDPSRVRSSGGATASGLNRDPFPSEVLTPPSLWDLLAGPKTVLAALGSLVVASGVLVWLIRRK